MANAAEKAENYRYMIDTAGGRDLEQHIRERADDHRGQLMTCRNWEEVLQHRAAAEALESVLLHIEQTIREGVEEDAEI